MDFSIWGTVPGSARIANTNPLTVGHLFYQWATGPIFIKALRFHRSTTGIFGKIDGCIYDNGTGVPIPGTAVSITLPQGSGPTGWITLSLPAPLELTFVQPGYVVAFHFPGGSGNGIPQSQSVPTGNPGETTGSYWSLGPGAYGWKQGTLRFPQHPFNAQGLPVQSYQGRFLAGPTLAFPTVASDADFGLDVTLSDTDPNVGGSGTSGTTFVPPPDTVHTLWGPTPPATQVPAVLGPAVVGLEFTPLRDVWATTLRVYRPQSTRPLSDNTPTAISWSGMNAAGQTSRPGGPGVSITSLQNKTITAALYTVNSATSGTLVPDSSLTFSEDKITIPVFGKAIVVDGRTGWTEAYLHQPLVLAANQRHRIVVGWTEGRPSLPGYFSGSGAGAQGLASGPLFVHGTGTATGGASSSVITGTSTLAFPTTASDAHPFLDVTVTTENPNDPREPENPVRVFGTVFPTNQALTIGIGARTVALEFVATAPVTAYGLRYLVYQGIAASSGRLYAVTWDGTAATPTGTPVAGSDVTFPASPGADGWQFVAFKAPIRLAVGQRYKIAVRFTNGYVISQGYFATDGDGDGGVTNGPITMPAPAAAAGAVQGSYALDDVFPDQTFNGANPWVDLTVAPGGSTAAGIAGTSGEPSSAITLWGAGAPDAVVVANPNTRVVGLEFMVAKASSAYGYRFYRPTTAITGAVQVRLYSVQGDDYATEVIGGDTTFTLSAVGWVYAGLRAPIALVPGRRYKMVFYFPSGYPTTPDYFIDGAPGSVNDIVNNSAGVGLRAFSLANATRGMQPTAMVGGTASDTVVYPTAAATDNPWLDITVVDGVAGAVTTGEEPAGVQRAWPITDPAPGNITQAFGPAVVGHQFTLSQNLDIYGLRMWRPDLRQQVTQGRIYRVDTTTTVSGTTVTFPPSTNRGWIYAPFSAPATLQAGVAYRVVAGHPVLGPSTVNALTAPTTAGAITTQSSWTVTAPADATLALPTTVSSSNYWLDITGLPAAGVPANVLTLFGSTPDATVTVRTDGPMSVGTTFAGQLDASDTIGTFWIKAIRFWRPTLGITGTVTGRIYEVTLDHRERPIPNTDVVISLAGNNATGWITAELPFPVALSTFPWYRVAMFFPSGFPATANYFITGPGGQDRYGPGGILFTGAYNYGGGDRAQGAFLATTSLAYPYRGVAEQGGEYGSNYWTDVVCTTTAPDIVPPPNPRFPLSYSQWGQIASTTYQVGNQIRYAQIAFAAVAGAGSVGLEFSVDTPAYLHGYRVPRVDASQQLFAPSARLYEITGPAAGLPVGGSDATFVFSASYWQDAHLDTAVVLVPGKKYKAVFFFPDAVPVGRLYSDTVDIVRGPLRVPANTHATAGATVTYLQSFSLTYPPAPSPNLGGIGTPIVDLYVSTEDPQAPTPDVRSIFDRRRPPNITYQAWGPQQNTDGTLSSGWTAGMEFYVTTSTCYFKGYRLWKAPYPVVTQATIFKLYKVTGPASPPGSGYYPPADIDFNITAGTEVAGTTITQGLYVSDQNQNGAYSEGWVTLSIPSPVALQVGTRYRIAVFYPIVLFNSAEPVPVSSRPMTDFFWKTGPGAYGIVDGPLIAPGRDTSTSAQQAPFDSAGIINPGPSDYPDIAFPGSEVRSNAAHYWIDLEIYDSAPRFVDGGIVAVNIPNAAVDPRHNGIDTDGLVTATLGVSATVLSERFSFTDPHAPPLDVQAVGIGGLDIVAVAPGVVPSGGGTKYVDGGIVAHGVPVDGRQAARRPKGVSDGVVYTVGPAASAHETIEWRAMPREPDLFAPGGGYGDLRFIAQDIMTRRWAYWDLPINNPTITWNLSGPFQLTGSLNPSYIDLLDMGVDEWATFIHVEIGGVIWGTGILMPWSAKGEEFSIEAYGVSSYAQGIPYVDNFVWSEFIPDAMEVIREMWRHIQSFENGNMGVQLPAGLLGLPVFGEPAYDDTTGELLGWHYTTLTWTDFTDIGAYIDQLAKSQPFDYVEVDAWNAAHTDVLHGIKFGYPRVGEKQLSLLFSEGENVLEAIPISEPDDAFASDIILKGAGEGPTQIYSWVGDSIWNRLRRVLIITDTQVQSQAAADGIAIAELIRRLYLRGIDQLVVDAFHPHAPFGSYRVGDDILIDGMMPWIGEFLLWHRILAIALQPETGLATLTVQRSEAFRYGRPDPLTGHL